MPIKPELKIIADHLRSSSFLIADGVLPSNEGRGYVLRRIMRRAMRQIHKLGAREVVMYKLVDALIKEMGAAYPELSRAREVIIETLKNEEEKFRETLEKGLKILEEEIARNKKLSGAIAFKLYDTYGFPLDLTQDIAKEKNLEIDIEEFNHEMEIQRERARKNWIGSGEEKEDKIFFELKEKFGETKFLGYEKLKSSAKILTISDKFIILDQTPFYATSGGQKGDDGIIKGKNGEIKISETKKFAGNLFVHFVSEAKGELKIGDEVEAIVNEKTRQARAQNHSATHLLHKALKEVLGNSISQKGSNVDADYFTFDFNFNRALTTEELTKVENLVNIQIQLNNPVNTNLMALDQARKSGAEALFGEKYDAEVRVVKMGPSIELCGGTHVKNTGEIQDFKIISENSVASGIRRILAKTAAALAEHNILAIGKLKEIIKDLQEKNYKKNEEIVKLGGKKFPDINEENPEKLAEILLQELKKKDKEIEKLKKQNLLQSLDNIKAETVGKVNLISYIFNDIEAKDLREITLELKNKFQNSYIFALFAVKEDKVSLCIAISNNLLEKFDSTKLILPAIEIIEGKGGGGKKDLAMGGGTNKTNIPHAIEIIKKSILI